MKKTYLGQSKALRAYYIKAIVISVMILGSAIVLTANRKSEILLKHTPLTGTDKSEIIVSSQYISNGSRMAPLGSAALLNSIFFKGYDQQTAGLF